MGGNYPDDYRPWLHGGPDEPPAMMECGQCIHWWPCPCDCGWGWCSEREEMTEPDESEECPDFQGWCQ